LQRDEEQLQEIGKAQRKWHTSSSEKGKWLPEEKRIELADRVVQFFDQKDLAVIQPAEALRYQVGFVRICHHQPWCCRFPILK
jgi:hypothetical protein